MAKLTAAQRKWLKGVQKALSAPGSEGMAFATGGDNIIVYSSTHKDEMDEYRGDPIDIVNQNDLELGELVFPSNVEGWCI